MPIKKENKRITITITPQQEKLIDLIKHISKCKSNTKAIRTIFNLANNQIEQCQKDIERITKDV